MSGRDGIVAAACWLAEASPAGGGLPPESGLADLACFAYALWESLPPPAVEPRCGKGCAGCCHQRACVTPADALVLAPLMRTAAIRARLRGLRVRGASQYDPWSGWLTAGIACPLLDEAGACSVHPSRALVCREHLVASDPAHCRDPSGTGVVLIPPPVPAGDALAQACATLRGSPVERIPIDAVPAWSRRHRSLASRRWPRASVLAAFLGPLSGPA